MLTVLVLGFAADCSSLMMLTYWSLNYAVQVLPRCGVSSYLTGSCEMSTQAPNRMFSSMFSSTSIGGSTCCLSAPPYMFTRLEWLDSSSKRPFVPSGSLIGSFDLTYFEMSNELKTLIFLSGLIPGVGTPRPPSWPSHCINIFIG